MKKRKLISGILFIIITAFIFWNSAKPAVESSEQSGFLVRAFLKLFPFFSEPDAIKIVRKSAHITEFFAQAAVMSVFFFENLKKYAIYILFAGLLTAVTDEFIQLFAEGRAGMIQDVFIDFSGTVAALAVFLIIYFKRAKG